MGNPRNVQVACLIAVLAGGTACAPTTKSEGDGGDATPFAFSSFAETYYDVRIVDASGAPLSGVAVSIGSVYVPDFDEDTEGDVDVYTTGVTDADGKLLGSMRLPLGVAQVDVVVDGEGRVGPWSDDALQDELGAFAPSSRLTRDLDGSALELTVVLEDA